MSLHPTSRRTRFAPFLVVISGAAALAFALITGVWILIQAQTTPITLIIGGEASEVRTRARTVAEFLDEQELTLGEGDRISPPLETTIRADLRVQIERAHPVFVQIDGAARTLWTTRYTPAEILDEIGVRVGPEDFIAIDGAAADPEALMDWPVPASRVTVRHAVPIRIRDGDVERVLHTSSETVGDALFDAGITLYLADTITPPLNMPVIEGMQVTIQRAYSVVIDVDGERIETRIQGDTVADALAESGVVLVGLDYSVPAESVALRQGMTIRIFRVREEIQYSEQPMPYETVYEADPTMELDTRVTAQAGQEGLQRTFTRVRYENGVAVSREVESTTIVRPPQDHIIRYGTNVVIRTIDTPNGPREYWRTFRVYATSYHPAALGGDNVTATGRILRHGIIGADPDLLPYGTEIYVEGYGVGIIADTGAPRHSTRWIDLGYSDDDYVNWHRYVTIYVLTPVPDNIDYFPPP